MTQFGYTMMTEQAGPKELVDHVVRAEEAGFDFSVTSDHYVPWLDEQGHAPYAWSVLGAAAQATSRIPLMTYVTCPTVHYHPAVVAQKAATMQLLSDGRFRLGLGSGENLNEHVVGGGWPAVDVRQKMLAEAVEIIRALFGGGYVNHRGEHFDVESAKLWDLPDRPPPIGVAVSGTQSCEDRTPRPLTPRVPPWGVSPSGVRAAADHGLLARAGPGGARRLPSDRTDTLHPARSQTGPGNRQACSGGPGGVGVPLRHPCHQRTR